MPYITEKEYLTFLAHKAARRPGLTNKKSAAAEARDVLRFPILNMTFTVLFLHLMLKPSNKDPDTEPNELGAIFFSMFGAVVMFAGYAFMIHCCRPCLGKYTGYLRRGCARSRLLCLE
ncbi:hypothetical protein WAI453_011216 [Rhynchosporium graminicola]